MTFQVIKEDRSTVQGVAWFREEPNVLDIHRLKQCNKNTSTHTQTIILRFENSKIRIFPFSPSPSLLRSSHSINKL